MRHAYLTWRKEISIDEGVSHRLWFIITHLLALEAK